MLKFWNEARKTVTALAIGALGWATAVVESPDPGITGTEWIAGATFVLIGLGVWKSTNKPAA